MVAGKRWKFLGTANMAVYDCKWLKMAVKGFQ